MQKAAEELQRTAEEAAGPISPPEGVQRVQVEPALDIREYIMWGSASVLAFGAQALLVAGAALAITSLEGWLLMPMLTSRIAHANDVAVFVALIFWSFVWGIWGTLLAVPMLVSLKACCDNIDRLKQIGELLGK